MIKTMMQLTVFLVSSFLMTISLAATKKNVPTMQLLTVGKTANVQSFLYFQGNIQPLKQYDILTPIAGLVGKDLNFTYGAAVKKDQYLLSIVPSDKQNAYRTSLIAYLRSKSTYSDSLTKFDGQQLLYKNGILSRNSFVQYKNTLVDQKLALKEAFYSLKAIIYKMSNDNKAENSLINNLSSLTIDNNKVYDALDERFNKVKIHAPITGIALLPVGNGAQGNDAQGNDASKVRLHNNSLVKLDQVLLTVGDFTGLKVAINVSEVSINKLHLGQPAIVTGPAFPNIRLHGKINTISYQANASSFGGSLPTYPVSIVVPKLTTVEKKIIHAGMTAKVQITLDEGQKILIPLKAVHIKNGKAYVMKSVNGKISATLVITGNTTLDTVEITSGLKAGDKIAISN